MSDFWRQISVQISNANKIYNEYNRELFGSSKEGE
jgi:hypothetical protein